MTKRSWVQTPTPYTEWMLAMMQAITLKKIERKGSQIGHTKKNILKKFRQVLTSFSDLV